LYSALRETPLILQTEEDLRIPTVRSVARELIPLTSEPAMLDPIKLAYNKPAALSFLY